MGKTIIASAFLALAGAGTAEAHPITFRWRAPPECPDEAWAKRQLEANLRQSLDGTPSLTTVIRSEVIALPTGQFEARLIIASEQGERRRVLQHFDCYKLAEATTLVTAMAILPALPEPVPTTPPARGREFRGWLGIGGAVHAGVGQLPSLANGYGFWFEAADGRHLYAALRLRRFSAQNVPVDTLPGATVRLSRLGVEARACLTAPTEPRLALCIGPEYGRILGVGYGLDVNRSASAYFGVLWAGIAGDIGLTRRISLVFGLDAGVDFVRPRFVIDGFGDVFRPGSLSTVGWAGLVVRPFAKKSTASSKLF